MSMLQMTINTYGLEAALKMNGMKVPEKAAYEGAWEQTDEIRKLAGYARDMVIAENYVMGQTARLRADFLKHDQGGCFHFAYDAKSNRVLKYLHRANACWAKAVNLIEECCDDDEFRKGHDAADVETAAWFYFKMVYAQSLNDLA